MCRLTQIPDWQRSRALELHCRFSALEQACGVSGVGLVQALGLEAKLLNNQPYHQDRDGKIRTHRASFSTLRREYYRWKDGGRTPGALLLQHSGGKSETPEAFRTHLIRLLSQPTGGRAATGLGLVSAATNQVKLDWKAGKSIPGFGTWREWWQQSNPGIPLPTAAPPFPLSDRTLYRHAEKVSKSLRALGNRGASAREEHSQKIPLRWSALRQAELFTLDDVRLDFVAINSAGQAVCPILYLLMECGSRLIVGRILRWAPFDRTLAGPDGAKYIKAEDVDELLAGSLLQSTGGYPTTLLFERGSVACSDAAKLKLEALAGFRVRRTGMDASVRWIGEARDRACGRSTGKSVIESFNRWLHAALIALPGQRGNDFTNKPQNLEATIRTAEETAARAAATGKAVAYRTALLPTWEAEAAIDLALERHNSEPGREFSGHSVHAVDQIQAPSGQWIDAATWPDAPANLPRRTARRSNSPLQEWNLREGSAAPLSDDLAAVIASRAVWREPTRLGIEVDGEHYWSPDSLTLFAGEARNEKGQVLCLLNPHTPDRLHILTPAGGYLETLPSRKSLLESDPTGITRSQGAALVQRVRERDAAILQAAHAEDTAATLAREASNRSALTPEALAAAPPAPPPAPPVFKSSRALTPEGLDATPAAGRAPVALLAEAGRNLDRKQSAKRTATRAARTRTARQDADLLLTAATPTRAARPTPPPADDFPDWVHELQRTETPTRSSVDQDAALLLGV